MRKFGKSIPTYRLHKPTGNAVATIGGKNFYQGEDILGDAPSRAK